VAASVTRMPGGPGLGKKGELSRGCPARNQAMALRQTISRIGGTRIWRAESLREVGFSSRTGLNTDENIWRPWRRTRAMVCCNGVRLRGEVNGSKRGFWRTSKIRLSGRADRRGGWLLPRQGMEKNMEGARVSAHQTHQRRKRGTKKIGPAEGAARESKIRRARKSFR